MREPNIVILVGGRICEAVKAPGIYSELDWGRTLEFEPLKTKNAEKILALSS